MRGMFSNPNRPDKRKDKDIVELHSSKGGADKNAVCKTNKIYLVGDLPVSIRGLYEYKDADGKPVIADQAILDSQILRPLKALERHIGTRYVPNIRNITIDLGDSKGATAEKSGESDSEQGVQRAEFALREPLWDLEDIYLTEEARRQVESTLKIITHQDKLLNEWGLKKILKRGKGAVLNFHGPSGTGKTITAEAIAKQLGKQLLVVSYPELESKYVGETPKNIQKVFRLAMENDAVLVFDEADSFLGHRLTNITQAADYGVNVTRSTMLMEIEAYSGILIFTTNLMRNYDPAFARRILTSIYLGKPDRKGREILWTYHIPKVLPLRSGVNIDELAATYEDITGADIRDAVVAAALLALNDEEEAVSRKHFGLAMKSIYNRHNTGQSKGGM